MESIETNFFDIPAEHRDQIFIRIMLMLKKNENYKIKKDFLILPYKITISEFLFNFVKYI